MPGVIVKIKSLYRILPNAERSVAQYVMNHTEEVPFYTVHQLAEKAKVSVASVIRFVQKIGYAGLKDFRVELAKDTSSSVTELYKTITIDDSDAEIARKVFLGQIRSLQETLKILNTKDLTRAARAIGRCKRILFFGVSGSGHIAQDAALRLCYLGYHADAYADGSQIVLHAARVQPKEVVFGISHSGRSTIVVQGLRIAAQRRALTIGISNYMKSPLHDTSDIFFCTSFPEDRVRVAALSSEVAQVCIIDVLYLLAAKHREHLEDTEEVNSLTESMLRIQE